MTTFEIEIKGKKLIIETGEIAKQSDGSVVLRYGDTVVLATAVAAKNAREGLDFFPLTIDYQEKAYSAGKIPGGFFKREGRPSEKEVLTSRLIDRPIRPLFPKGFSCETQGIVSVLSYGDENVSDVFGITGMSAALMISDIPFDGPVAAVRVGRINGDLTINPDLSELEKLDMNLVVAGTKDSVLMVEGATSEVSEEALLKAIDYAHAEIKRITAMQIDLRNAVGKEKRLVTPPVVDEELRLRLNFDFVDVMNRKHGEIVFNGHQDYFDTKELTYTFDLSDDAVRGNNALKIKPGTTLEIRELKVDLVD